MKIRKPIQQGTALVPCRTKGENSLKKIGSIACLLYTSYGMMFGETTKDFFLKQIKGRGYVDVGTSVISEFYTPLVPKGHDFLKEIKKLINSRQEVQAACEAKAAEAD